MSFRVMNRGINPVVRALLRSPLHPLLSGSVLLIELEGRRSGRRHAVPVQFAESGDEIVVVVGSPEKKRWWRNLVPEAPVRLLLRGRWQDGHATVLERDAEATAPRLERYFERFPSSARQLGVRRGDEGRLERSGVLALAARAVLVVLRVPPPPGASQRAPRSGGESR